jgi:SOS-response transcriptional repressor LexA
MRVTALSQRQQAILRFFYDYSQANSLFPTIREICWETGIASTSITAYNLSKMVNLGHLRHASRRSRSYPTFVFATELAEARKYTMYSATNPVVPAEYNMCSV